MSFNRQEIYPKDGNFLTKSEDLERQDSWHERLKGFATSVMFQNVTLDDGNRGTR